MKLKWIFTIIVVVIVVAFIIYKVYEFNLINLQELVTGEIVNLSAGLIVYLIGRKSGENHKEIAKAIVDANKEVKEKENEEQERLRRNKLILNDLEIWMGKTTSSRLEYVNGKIESEDYKDPELDYWIEDVKVLKEWSAYTLWEEAINNSKTLKNNGINAINEFQKIVDEKLKSVPLNKSVDVQKWMDEVNENTYCFPLVCQAIFEIVNDKGKDLKIEPNDLYSSPKYLVYSSPKYLEYGETKIAMEMSSQILFSNLSLDSLKLVIEDLAKDEDVKRAIDKYNECEKSLSSREPFKGFEKQIEKIIAKFRLYQDFRPHS